jgi:hypothetical protein
MAYAGVWPIGWPPIDDAADIGEAGGKPDVMLPGFHTLGDIFIIWPFAAIVFNNWGSAIVVNSSHATPASIG